MKTWALCWSPRCGSFHKGKAEGRRDRSCSCCRYRGPLQGHWKKYFSFIVAAASLRSSSITYFFEKSLHVKKIKKIHENSHQSCVCERMVPNTLSGQSPPKSDRQTRVTDARTGIFFKKNLRCSSCSWCRYRGPVWGRWKIKNTSHLSSLQLPYYSDQSPIFLFLNLCMLAQSPIFLFLNLCMLKKLKNTCRL